MTKHTRRIRLAGAWLLDPIRIIASERLSSTLLSPFKLEYASSEISMFFVLMAVRRALLHAQSYVLRKMEVATVVCRLVSQSNEKYGEFTALLDSAISQITYTFVLFVCFMN